MANPRQALSEGTNSMQTASPIGIFAAIVLAVIGPATAANAQDGQPASDSPTAEPVPAEPVPAETMQGDESLTARIKQPVDWLSWGFDLRLRETYIGNSFTLNKKSPGHEWHWQRQRVRWWATITPNEDLAFNLRIAWEGKHFDRPLERENWQPTSVLFDQLNVRYNHIFGLPLEIRAGRQDLMLGDRWLVMDGTPLDGSSTVYFDAVRFTLDLDEINTNLDLVYLEQDAEGDVWIRPIHHEHCPLIEQDETGAIVWLTNKSLPQTQLDGYLIYKRATPALPGGDQAEIYTIGARAEHCFQ